MNTMGVSATAQQGSTSTATADRLTKLRQDLARKKDEQSNTKDGDEEAILQRAIADLEMKIAKATAELARGSVTLQKSNDGTPVQLQFSGESERIGTVNFDAKTEFGGRVIYV
ncbi:hypothetical protein [Rhizobium sp. Leaf386]|uniref:hypothetical protein n=1 Tax=Rhizobium sp. Leaf386 TaxID=1736359 RepID=UPI0007128051|nr:hypothetical protein [Rhizobium sp. Leaf386]KQT04854.1 hypothetical protein ASG50_16570 [Rhizobium sp. Leaf386]